MLLIKIQEGYDTLYNEDLPPASPAGKAIHVYYLRDEDIVERERKIVNYVESAVALADVVGSKN